MKDCVIGFKVSEETKKQLLAMAQKRDITLSQLIRELIRTAMENSEE